MWPFSSSSGTVSTNVSLPWSRITSVTGSSWARNSTNSVMPPSWRNFSSTGVAPRRSRITSSRPGHDERRLTGPAEQTLELERGVLGEDLAVRPEPDAGAGPALGHAAALARQPGPGREAGRRPVARRRRPGAPRRKLMPWADGRPVDVDVHPRRQRVDDRQADAVQAARGDVGAATELAAGVQLGGHHLDAGQPGLGLLVGGDAATVVVDLGRPVGVQGHLHGVRGAGQRLVDPVVDDLPQALHQTAGVGGADVHARPLAHRLEPLEDEEVSGVVGVVGDRRAPAVERWCCCGLRGPTYPRPPTRRRCHAWSVPVRDTPGT